MPAMIFDRITQKALIQIEAEKKRKCGRDFKPTGKAWRDTYCEDGMIASGNRIIKKGGVIFFGKSKWQDDELIPFVGKLVGVTFSDYWGTAIEVFWRGYPLGEHWMRIVSNPVMPSGDQS